MRPLVRTGRDRGVPAVGRNSAATSALHRYTVGSVGRRAVGLRGGVRAGTVPGRIRAGAAFRDRVTRYARERDGMRLAPRRGAGRRRTRGARPPRRLMARPGGGGDRSGLHRPVAPRTVPRDRAHRGPAPAAGARSGSARARSAHSRNTGTDRNPRGEPVAAPAQRLHANRGWWILIEHLPPGTGGGGTFGCGHCDHIPTRRLGAPRLRLERNPGNTPPVFQLYPFLPPG